VIKQDDQCKPFNFWQWHLLLCAMAIVSITMHTSFFHLHRILVSFDSSFLHTFEHLLGLWSFDSPKGHFTHKQISIPIAFNDIGLISIGTIASTTSLGSLSQPHFGQVWGWSATLGKVGDLESSGTPDCLELDSKGKNTSHWGVLGVFGKVLKRRYRKCPRIGNSDICSPSYGQKEGPGVKLAVWLPTTKSRESMPSRQRATTSVQTSSRSKSAIESYGGSKFRESCRDNFGTISGLHFGTPGNLCHLDVGAAERRRVYYMGDGGGIPRVQAVMSLVVRSARALSQHQRVSRKEN
jgi:hypothetical protein